MCNMKLPLIISILGVISWRLCIASNERLSIKPERYGNLPRSNIGSIDQAVVDKMIEQSLADIKEANEKFIKSENYVYSRRNKQ